MRAFTLMELMVVVLIIAVLAALAIPSMLGGQHDRRAFQVSADTSAMLREGRARAVGRGIAVGVYLEVISNELHATMYEDGLAVALDAGPAAQVGGCKGVDWTTAPKVSELHFAGGVYSQGDVQARILMGGTAYNNAMVCFSPAGRIFVKPGVSTRNDIYGEAGMVEPLEVEVARKPGGTVDGLTRTVVLTPAGATRIVSK
jgi:prepilin-type N-terminal cleavage/methylation domain-containing protein